jgi:hypothetical protein
MLQNTAEARLMESCLRYDLYIFALADGLYVKYHMSSHACGSHFATSQEPLGP